MTDLELRLQCLKIAATLHQGNGSSDVRPAGDVIRDANAIQFYARSGDRR